MLRPSPAKFNARTASVRIPIGTWGRARIGYLFGGRWPGVKVGMEYERN